MVLYLTISYYYYSILLFKLIISLTYIAHRQSSGFSTFIFILFFISFKIYFFFSNSCYLFVKYFKTLSAVCFWTSIICCLIFDYISSKFYAFYFKLSQSTSFNAESKSSLFILKSFTSLSNSLASYC